MRGHIECKFATKYRNLLTSTVQSSFNQNGVPTVADTVHSSVQLHSNTGQQRSAWRLQASGRGPFSNEICGERGEKLRMHDGKRNDKDSDRHHL